MTSPLPTSCLSPVARQTEGHFKSGGEVGAWAEVSGDRRKMLCHSLKSHYSYVHATHSSLGRSGIHYLPSAPTFWLWKYTESFKISSHGQTVTRKCSWLRGKQAVCTAPSALPLPLPALPQCQQLLARQGEESWGRNGPQVALHISLVYSTGAVSAAVEKPACRHPQIAVDWRKQSLTFIFWAMF